MTDTDTIYTDGATPTFVAISASNYAEADLAVWRFKNATDSRPINPIEAQHLETLRGRRRETYFDLVSWVMRAEAERLGGRSD